MQLKTAEVQGSQFEAAKPTSVLAFTDLTSDKQSILSPCLATVFNSGFLNSQLKKRIYHNYTSVLCGYRQFNNLQAHQREKIKKNREADNGRRSLFSQNSNYQDAEPQFGKKGKNLPVTKVIASFQSFLPSKP